MTRFFDWVPEVPDGARPTCPESEGAEGVGNSKVSAPPLHGVPD